jgi:glyoxylase-like metal-dependent hydrolase (beta-lactamase superfamily II)
MGSNQLSAVVPDAIWVTERAVWFSGVRLRARSTVIRLADGALLVHSPPAPTDELCAALRELGEVRWIVVPNCFHHLGASAMAARFASAKVVGPSSAVRRNRQLKLHMALTDEAFLGAVPELETIALDGCPFLDETVLFHRSSGSLIAADLVMSACARDHWTWRWAARIKGCYDKVRAPPDVEEKTKRNDAAARSIENMAALPLKRLLVAHADVIEDPAEKLREAWRFVRET